MTVAREWPCKRHITAGYRGDRGNTTIEELWEEVFSVWSMLRLYNWSPLKLAVSLGKEVLGPD
jgi:hypothetical protein